MDGLQKCHRTDSMALAEKNRQSHALVLYRIYSKESTIVVILSPGSDTVLPGWSAPIS